MSRAPRRHRRHRQRQPAQRGEGAGAGRRRRPRHAPIPTRWRRADKIVVPGQGAFGGCVAGLDRGGGALRQAVLEPCASGKPYLGFCLGLQILFEGSDERPEVRRAGDHPRARASLRRAAARQGPAHGLERRAPRAGRRAWPGWATRPTARTSTSCTATTRSPRTTADVALYADYGGRVLRGGGPRQRAGGAVPPRKEPGGGDRASVPLRRRLGRATRGGSVSEG